MVDRAGLAARLRAAFLDDLDEQLGTINADLLALEAEPGGVERLKSLFRAAHTLKGAARAAGLPSIESLCHALEERLTAARDGRQALGPAHFRLLFAAADALAAAGTALRAGAEPDPEALASLSAALESPDAAPPGAPPAAHPPASDPPAGEAPASPGPPSAATAGPPAPSAEPAPFAPSTGDEPVAFPPPPSFLAAAAERGDSRVRVEAARLDELLASVERLLLARGRLEAHLPRLRELLGEAISGGSGDRQLSREADRLGAALAADLRALSQVAGELGDGVRRARMRPFAEAAEALPRVVRDLAAASGKEVRLTVTGGEVEADRAVIDAVREALLHLVRNAVDHGLEPPADRVRAGKPPAGTLAVTASVQGEFIAVTVADDGRGLDAAAIRAALERRGRPAPEDGAALARALLQGGVSTRATADAISGRGVGLDAARAAVERVRGSVGVAWTGGAGATFTLECPLTLATLRALTVRVGGHVFAIPTAGVERLSRVDPAGVRRAGDRLVVPTPEGPVPVVPLARVLGPPLAARPAEGWLSAVHLRAGGRRLIVAVDELLDEQELVVRPLDRGRAELPHLGGAALLGTGAVALVVNPAAVVETGLGSAAAGAGPELATVRDERAGARRILVVDDSITTRTLEQSTLEAAGYAVTTAVDGADAWRLLQEQGADLVVSDVEMPRMDGVQLCEAIRASRRFADLPVVLVTSLEQPEQRDRGLEAGADAYIGKSGFDQQGLLETIRRLLG